MAAGNGAIAAAQIISAGANAVTSTADAAHNGAEVLLAGTLAENATNNNLSERTKDRLRKVSYWGICTVVGGLGVKAGVDLSIGHDTKAHEANLYASGASLGLSTYLTARLKHNVSKLDRVPNAYENDLLKHYYSVDLPLASAAFAGAVLQKYGAYGYEQLLAVFSSARAAWVFRPTRKNLAHDCPSHGSGPHMHDIPHEHSSKHQSNWMRRSFDALHSAWQERKPRKHRRRLAIGVGLASLALASGYASDHASQEADSAKHTPSPSIAKEATPRQHTPPAKPPKAAKPSPPYFCITINPGDTIWDIAESRLRTVTPKVTDTEIDAFTKHIAHKNKASFPDPNLIQPDKCLQVPTPDTLRSLSAQLLAAS